MTAIAALMHSIARQKSSDFNEIWYTTAHLELSNSQMTKCDFKKFKMADGRHFKNCFGHTSAVDCPISVVKLCVGKHAVFLQNFGNGTDTRVLQNVFFVFLIEFGLRRATAFVSSPIHLFIV